MVVILNNFSFQLERCMFSFRDAGIKKARTPNAWLLLTVDLMKKKIKESNILYQYFQSVQYCRWKG